MAFRRNPFYSYYVGELQKLANETTAAIVSGFQGERDLAAILEREQAIGAAPTYLKFASLVHSDLLDLQEKYKQQQ